MDKLIARIRKAGKLMPLSFLFVLMASFTAFAQADKRTVKTHPYLIYTSSRIGLLKNRINEDTAMNQAWIRMKTEADQSVNAGKGGNIEVLSLAYRMTGDKKYAGQAKVLLQQLIRRTAWDGMDDRTPRWNSGLATGKSSFLSAVTFDAIYDYLTKQERKEIAEQIVKLGIKPAIGDWISEDQRIHSLNSMGHNWWSAIVHEAGVASLAIMNEVPEAKEWAEEVMRTTNEWFDFSGSVLDNKPSTFDISGGFYESVSYANYGISEYLLFRVAYTNAFSPIRMPYDSKLEKTMDWFINASYPTNERLMSLNFGDSSPNANGDKPVKLMIALGFSKDRYYWYLDQTSKAQFREAMSINTPLGILYNPERKSVPATPDLPLSSVYKNMGWAMLRSSWDKNATMLGVKSGFTWNHTHADAGSFVLYHNGKNLLIDGGDVGYGLPEYSDYFVRSEAHNVMLFNGKAQDPQDQYYAVKNPGNLYHLLAGDNFKYLLADAAGPTSRYFLRNYRNFIWVGNVILIIDDVKAYEPGRFEWLLHFGKEATKKGQDIEVTDDSAAVLIRPLFPETLPSGYPHDFPEKMQMEERTGIKDRDVKTKITYYSIFPPETSRQTKFINAIVLLDDKKNKPVEAFVGSSGAVSGAGRSNLPKLEKLEGKDFIGVRIIQDGKITDVYFNLLADGRLMHRNSINTINGWETDAYIMSVTYPEKDGSPQTNNINNYFIGNGSFLRRNGQTTFHSLSKVFLYAGLTSNQPDIIVQGQPLIHAKLRLIKKPQQLMLNGRKKAPVYGKGMLIMDIKEE